APGGTVTLDVERPVALRVSSMQGGEIAVTLHDGGSPTTATRTLVLPAGAPMWLEIATRSRITDLALPAGPGEVCGVG
ncbi:MAG TPA: hypothetical protein VFO60_01630, partial [Candidatus Dormibacteraeota bacterium]|nr:hypothetical protein [Candidatus Dormibacteraeota bacterium]